MTHQDLVQKRRCLLMRKVRKKLFSGMFTPASPRRGGRRNPQRRGVHSDAGITCYCYTNRAAHLPDTETCPPWSRSPSHRPRCHRPSGRLRRLDATSARSFHHWRNRPDVTLRTRFHASSPFPARGPKQAAAGRRRSEPPTLIRWLAYQLVRRLAAPRPCCPSNRRWPSASTANCRARRP